MDAKYLQSKHAAGLPYDAYVRSGKPEQYENWKRVYDAVRLTDPQKSLLASFVRKIHVIGVSGIWCGDCVQQCPLIQKIAEANPVIDIKWVDRDVHNDLQEKLLVNAGRRVPVIVFCAEDFELAGWFGDRTLRRYRAVAARQLGPACPLPGAALDPDELAATLQDWVDQFERIHLMLRLSPRLRKAHND